MRLCVIICWLALISLPSTQAVGIDKPFPAILMAANSFRGFDGSSNAAAIIAGIIPQARSNVEAVVRYPSPCPAEYVNDISNTNLFSQEEQAWIRHAVQDYSHVTTNSGPAGALLVGHDTALWPFTEGFDVSEYQYPKTGNTVRFYFQRQHLQELPWARFRTPGGDGYDLSYSVGANGQGVLWGIRQFKHGELDGLWADFEDGRCSAWMRFRGGKAVGQWLVWNKPGTLYMVMKFKQPFDYMGWLNYNP